MIVLFLPHGLSFGIRSISLPQQTWAEKDKVLHTVLRADTIAKIHPTAEHFGGSLKAPSEPQSDVWSQSALLREG